MCNLRLMAVSNKFSAVRFFLLLNILSVCSIITYGQGNSGGRPLRATTRENFQFGAFAVGATGGQLQLSPAGVRTATGTVVPLNLGLPVSSLLIEIRADDGTIISVLMNNVQLTGSNGGSMTLSMGNTNPVSPFVFPNIHPPKLDLFIGGNLTVGNTQSVPPGNYFGTLYVTFMVE